MAERKKIKYNSLASSALFYIFKRKTNKLNHNLPPKTTNPPTTKHLNFYLPGKRDKGLEVWGKTFTKT